MREQQRHGRRRFGTVIAAGAAMSVLIAAPAAANHGDWTAGPGTTVEDGALVMDTSDEAATPAGTSYETADLGVELADGDVISFAYALEDAVCGGGQPRIFVEIDGAYTNTFDGNPDACGDDGMGATSGTVTYTYQGDGGMIGHAGIVFDNVSDRGIATITDVTIGGFSLDLADDGDDDGDGGDQSPTAKDQCKRGGWNDYGFRNQGQCIKFVNTGKDSRA